MKFVQKISAFCSLLVSFSIPPTWRHRPMVLWSVQWRHRTSDL